MHRDPVTWSIQERIARCREQAAFFETMAEAESRFVARDLLIELARQLIPWRTGCKSRRQNDHGAERPGTSLLDWLDIAIIVAGVFASVFAAIVFLRS